MDRTSGGFSAIIFITVSKQGSRSNIVLRWNYGTGQVQEPDEGEHPNAYNNVTTPANLFDVITQTSICVIVIHIMEITQSRGQ